MRVSKLLGTIVAAVAVMLAAVAAVAVMLAAGAAAHGIAPSIGATAAAQTLPPTPAPAPLPAGSITVMGQGTATGAPDIAFITLGVQTMGTAVKDATDSNSSTVAAILAAVKAQNVTDQDIQTAGFSITPVYGQPDAGGAGTTSITGFRVSNTVNVTLNDLSAAGKVLGAAVQAGANSAVGIRFAIKDPTAVQQQALNVAMQQAGAKADTLAKAAGLKLNGAFTVTEQSANAPIPVAQDAAAATGGGSASPPVEQGQLIVRATVSVSYLYTR